MISLTLKLFIAHMLGDFVFQPDRWVEDKKVKHYKSRYFYYHLFVHLFFLWLLLGFRWYYWPLVLISVGSHFFIDLGKLKLEKVVNHRWLFFVDQLLHLIVIFLLAYFNEPFALNLEGLFSVQLLVFIAALLLLTSVSSVIVKTLISGWALNEISSKESLPGAGKYIGMLERLFIFTFIVLNQWQAIGFLIAAKSIFRFSDISKARDRKLTEYMLVGTLMSFGLATLTGLGYLYVMDFLS
jgi:hypothetical protein